MQSLNRRLTKVSLGIAISFWLLRSVALPAVENIGLPEQFAAEAIFSLRSVVVTNQIFRDHGQLRIQPLQPNGTNLPDTCLIFDWNVDQMIAVLHSLKQYNRLPIPNTFPKSLEPYLVFAPRTVQVLVGHERLGDVDWNKYLVSNTFMMAYLYTQTAPKPVMELRDTNGIIYCSVKNITVGQQSPDLFRVPENYQPVELMGGGSGGISSEPMLFDFGLPDEFYVEEVSTVQGKELRKMIWCKGGQMRWDLVFGEKKGRSIIDFGKGIQMIVDDLKQRVLVMPLNLCAGPVGSWEANLLWDGKVVIEDRGTEMVNGRKLIKRRLSNTKGSAIYYASVTCPHS